MKQHSLWRRFAIALLILSGALAVVAVVLVMTEPGRIALIRIAAKFASSPEQQITLSGLASPDIGTLSARGITISDGHGAWLSADGVNMKWSPRRLLRATLGIGTLSVEQVAIARRPDSTGEAGLPSLPNLPLWIDIGTLSAPRIELAAPVLGTADTLALVGRARILPGEAGPIVDGAVEITRLADAAARMNLAWSYSAAAGMLAVDGRLHQPANGALQALIGMRPDLPLTATLTGTGELTDWRGEITLNAGTTGTARGAATIRRDRTGTSIAASADADLASAFTGAAAELLAGTPHIETAIRIAGDGAATIDKFDFRSDAAAVTATGSLNAARDAWTAKFSAGVPNSDALRSVLPASLAFRDLAIEGDLSGSPSSASGGARLAASDGQFGAVAADRIQATLTPGEDGLFRLESEANGVRMGSQDLGKPPLLSAEGRLADRGLDLRTALARFGAAEARFIGEGRRDRVTGKVTLLVPDLADFSALAERPLAGSIALNADVDGNPSAGGIGLRLSGDTRSLRTGIPTLDRLLADAASISGGARLSPTTIALDDIEVRTRGAALDASGTLGASTQSQLTGNLKLDDLARLDERLSGEASIAAVLTGNPWAPEIAITATVPHGTAFGRSLENVTARYAGRIPAGALAGSVVFDGTVAGLPVTATARVSGQPSTLDISDLSARIASVSVTGALALQPGTFPAGTLTVSAPRLTELTPLIGVDAAGSLSGTINLPTADAGSILRIEANISNLRIGDLSVSRLAVTADEFDAAGRRASGTVSGSGLRLGDIAVNSISGRITGDPSGLDMDLEFALPDGTARFEGNVRREADGTTLAVRSFSASRNGETLRLAAPTDLRIADGAVSFSNLTLTSGQGSAEISGSVGSRIDLTARADGVRLSSLGLFVPRFGLGGRIDGNLTVSGPIADLTGSYDVRVANLTFGELQRAGIAALDLTAAGTFAGTRATARGRVEGPGGAALNFEGSVPLNAAGEVSLNVTGSLDLQDVNRAFRIAGGDLSGRLSIDGRVAGPLSGPGFAGTVGVAGGRYVDPAAGLDFRNITGTASANGRQLTIRALTASTVNSGQVSANGTIALGGNNGPVANIDIRAERARVISSSTATLDVSGAVRLDGPLARSPSVTGNLTIDRLDIELPRHLPQRVATLDVKHRNAPPDLQRLVIDQGRRSGGEAGNFDASLDLTVSAPGRIFIRGQGLEAELEGQIALRGTISAPFTEGTFRLRRGSMSVLAQRFDLTSATLTFAGDTDPVLDIVSRTQAADITAIFSITGTASAPEFQITSEPPMAEDEILSRLLFRKPSSNLTAGEALALARAASQLAGFSTGPGFLETLRRKTGLDRLTVSTDAAGNPVLDAGRYISDRTFLGVRQGARSDSTRATVDIDITRELKARGEIGSDGQSKFGVTVEHEY